MRGQRGAMAAGPPILAAKPRDSDFKAAPSHSSRDFAARIHSPLPKVYLAREQSRQLRRLEITLLSINLMEHFTFHGLTRKVFVTLS